MSRSQDRELAVRIVFTHQFNPKAHLDIARDILDNPELSALPAFTKAIIQARQETSDAIHNHLRSALKDGDVSRLAVMDRVILECAAAEMLTQPTIPKPVILNEYVELTKRYSTEASKRLINGVLDRLANESGLAS